MNNFINRLYNRSFQCMKAVILILSVVLFGTAFLTSAYAYMYNQQMLFAWDNLILSVISILFVVTILWLVTVLISRRKHGKRMLLLFVFLLYAIVTFVMIIFNKPSPAADQMTVFRIAEEFALSYYGAIHPIESYLSYCPHQIGLVAYYDGLLRIWNLFPGNVIGYHFIYIINMVWTEILIFCFYKILYQLFNEDKIQIIYLYLMILNLPLMFYITFAYGEVPSIAVFSIGLLFFIKILKEPTKSKLKYLFYVSVSTICFAFCVVLRKNMLIIMIAVFIVLFFTALMQKKYCLLFLNLLFIGACLITPSIIQTCYELRAGNYLNDGIPASAYIAMGMQDNEQGNGYYNRYNLEVYEQAGLDVQTASQTACTYISERIKYFFRNIGECFKFYFGKFQVQWCDGTYAALQATINTFSGRSQLFKNLYTYNGYVHIIFIFMCNVFQNLIYLGNCIFSFITFKDKDKKFEFIHFLCLIAVVGVFFFHILWEANSRYIFQAEILLLPTAAWGLNYLITYIQKYLRRVKYKVHILNDDI